jgi:FxsC-like protein
MAYEFFLSYTRANNDAFLKKFFADLSDVVRELRGEPAGQEVGFFDQQDLELGEDWDASLVEALQTSKVVVPVFSPAYFKSEYCGKELALFRQRCAAAVKPGQPLPPLIKPVIWVQPREGDIPESLGAGQYAFGDPQAIQNTKGFKHILKRLGDLQTKYNDLIEDLAQQIVKAGDNHPLPRLPVVPSLGRVAPLFPKARVAAPNGAGTSAGAGDAGAAGSSAAPMPATPVGPKHVRFVFVAADPQRFGQARRREDYLATGGADWKPYFPANQTRIHRFVQNVVASDELDFTSDELRFDQNLLAEILKAWEQRQIVVLIVDGWSLHWDPQVRTLLSQLDQRIDYHWCVLVPHNEDDPDASALRPQINAAISQTFDRHANLIRNPIFFREGLKTPDDLRSALRAVLTSLKEEIRKRASVDMPVPVGPPKTVVVGPSAAG